LNKNSNLLWYFLDRFFYYKIALDINYFRLMKINRGSVKFSMYDKISFKIIVVGNKHAGKT
jgi:hypothetical protein